MYIYIYIYIPIYNGETGKN